MNKNINQLQGFVNIPIDAIDTSPGLRFVLEEGDYRDNLFLVQREFLVFLSITDNLFTLSLIGDSVVLLETTILDQ